VSWLWRGLLAAAALGLVGLVVAILAGPEPPSRPDGRAERFCARLQARSQGCAPALRREARELADRLARSEDPDQRRLARHVPTLVDGALGGEAIQEQCDRRLGDPEGRALVDQVARCYQAADCPGFARCLREVAESLTL
jgi:hypothetical protein